MTSTVPPPSQFLWCDEHAEIAAWLARNNLGMEFYGSLINYCARTMDKLRRPNGRLIKDHLGHLRETLRSEPLSGAAVLYEMNFYYNRFFWTGPVQTGVMPLFTLLAQPDRIHSAHNHLYNKVFGRRVLAPSSTPSSAAAAPIDPLAVNGDTLAVVNGTSASSPAPATLPAPSSGQRPGLQGQLPLPDGPLLKTLPIREQPLAVASLEASLPALSAPAPASPEQQAREHGTLLLLGGVKEKEEEVLDELQDGEDGGVKV